MTPRARPAPLPGGQAAPQGRRPRWLLLVHQLPSHPSNLRVRTWRRLQQLGAMPIKQAVYVLPDSPGGREDFEWLSAEIKGAGGEASVFAAELVDRWSDDALVEEFRRSRQESYAGLARDVERVLARFVPTRRRRGARAPATQRLLGRFRQRLAGIEVVDFFGSAGRDRVTVLLKQLEDQEDGPQAGVVARQSEAGTRAQAYRGRLWVTRPRPGVDRMASAWLIRHFIDPQARFDFAASAEHLADGAVPFDMFGVDFSHRGRRVHVRDPVCGLRHPGGGCRAHRGDRARPRPQGRTVRCARGDDGGRRDRGSPARASRRPGTAGPGDRAV